MDKLEIRNEVAGIDLKIEELKKRRKALLSELGEGSLSWGAMIIGAFGALMIGLGVIALFAANWDVFGREARAAIAIAPVVACGAAAVWAYAKGAKSRALWEPLGILWCISVAAAACLVAQTYQVGGSVPSLILFVALLMLPVVWITRAVAPMALWPIMAIVWTCSMEVSGAKSSFALAAKGLALMALSLPAYIAFLRGRPPKPVLIPVQIATGFVYSLGLGILLSEALPISSNEGLVVAVFWMCAALVAGAGRVFSLPVWGMIGVIVAAGAAFPTPFLRNAPVNFYAALAIAGAIIAYGVAKLRIGVTNIGAVTSLWLVLGKFFESSVSFTVKGTVLIAAGVLLTALNMVLIRIRKARRA